MHLWAVDVLLRLAHGLQLVLLHSMSCLHHRKVSTYCIHKVAVAGIKQPLQAGTAKLFACFGSFIPEPATCEQLMYCQMQASTQPIPCCLEAEAGKIGCAVVRFWPAVEIVGLLLPVVLCMQAPRRQQFGCCKM